MQHVLKILLASCLLCAQNFFCCEVTHVDETVRRPVMIHCELDDSIIELSARVSNQLQTVRGFVASDLPDTDVPMIIPAEYDAETVRQLVAILDAKPVPDFPLSGHAQNYEYYREVVDQVIFALPPYNYELIPFQKLIRLASYLQAPSAVISRLSFWYGEFNQDTLMRPDLETVSFIQQNVQSICSDMVPDENNRLNLSGQYLPVIPSQIPANIKHFDISNNNFLDFAIPRSSEQMSMRLKYVDLSRNRIERLVAGSLCKLPPALRTIDLIGNPINRIEPNVSDGVQQGLTIYVDAHSLSGTDKDRFQKEFEKEANCFRYFRMLGAKVLHYSSNIRPAFYWALGIPIQLLLGAKYGHTKAWKIANIGFNGMALYNAVRQKKFGEGVGLILDSCQQFNRLSVVDHYMRARFGISPALFACSSFSRYSSWIAMAVSLLPRVPQRLKKVASQCNTALNALDLFNPDQGAGRLEASYYGFKRLFMRSKSVKYLVDRMHLSLDGWMRRTQNEVRFV